MHHHVDIFISIAICISRVWPKTSLDAVNIRHIESAAMTNM